MTQSLISTKLDFAFDRVTDAINLDGLWLDAEDIACLGMRRADRSDFFAEIRREEQVQLLHTLAALKRAGQADQSQSKVVEIAIEKPRRRHLPRISVPDGLRTKAEAAAKLGCSIKTLDGYIEAGTLRYVALGHGRKRVRRMFTDADLTEFISNQSRKDVPCPSIAPSGRRFSTSTSSGEVIGFTARRNARRAAKPKK